MMDFLSIAELASLSERRTFTLLDPNLNQGLPSMRIPSNGLNTGLMNCAAAPTPRKTKTAQADLITMENHHEGQPQASVSH